jgi:hypothetical protein
MRTRTVIAAIFTATLTLAPPSRAQSEERLSTVAPFALWLGEWKGSGWSMGPTGERTEFELTESVKERVAGSVLLVEGHGVRTSGAQKGAVSHDGIVLVYRDTSGRLRWNGHDAASGMLDAEIIPGDRGFQWSFKADARGTLVRFIIALDTDRWQESGDVSSDGTSWTRFMEMTLRKVAR